jgi:hypothetical protein
MSEGQERVKTQSPNRKDVTLNLIQGLFDEIKQNETIAKFVKSLSNDKDV